MCGRVRLHRGPTPRKAPETHPPGWHPPFGSAPLGRCCECDRRCSVSSRSMKRGDRAAAGQCRSIKAEMQPYSARGSRRYQGLPPMPAAQRVHAAVGCDRGRRGTRGYIAPRGRRSARRARSGRPREAGKLCDTRRANAGVRNAGFARDVAPAWHQGALEHIAHLHVDGVFVMQCIGLRSQLLSALARRCGETRSRAAGAAVVLHAAAPRRSRVRRGGSAPPGAAPSRWR